MKRCTCNLLVILCGWLFCQLLATVTWAEENSIGNTKPLIYSIKTTSQHNQLAPFITYYRDAQAQLTIEEVASLPAERFSHYPMIETPNDFGLTKDTIWLTFSVENQLQQAVEVVIEMANPLLDQFDLYYWQDGQLREWIGGNSSPIFKRSIKLNVLAFIIELEAGEKIQIFTRSASTTPLYTPLNIYTSDSYYEILSYTKLIEGLIIGILIGLFVYNIFLYKTTNHKNYITLVFYILTQMGYYLSNLGYTQFLLYEFPEWNKWFTVACGLFSMLVGCEFFRVYLETPRRMPRFDRIVYSVMVYFVVVCLPASFLFDYYVMVFLMVPAAIVMMLLQLIGCTISIREGYRPAKVYLFANIVLILAGMTQAIVASGLVPHPEQILLFPLLSIALMLILLSTGLSDHINQMKIEKSASEQKAIRAQVQNEAKSRFLAQMTHEIRTPMSGLLGVTHLLKETELNSGQTKYIDIIEESGKNLLSTINNILDFSKIEANKMEVDYVVFDIKGLLFECEHGYQPFAENKNIWLYLDIDEVLPQYLIGDARLVSTTLSNLVDNAIKFTEGGKVKIKVTVSDSSNNEIAIKVNVVDTGIGISPENQENLFRSFTQLQSSHARQYGGTGLGLTVARRLIELAGGSIGVDSELGQGANFWFTLTMPIPNKEEIHAFQQAQFAKQISLNKSSKSSRALTQSRILVAEDNSVNRLVIKGVLKKLGISPVMAEDGLIAVKLFKESDPPFDLIFMDCEMPNLDGFGATDLIRSYEIENKLNPIPIVALTAHNLSDLQRSGKANRMDDVLAKPLEKTQMRSMLHKHLGV